MKSVPSVPRPKPLTRPKTQFGGGSSEIFGLPVDTDMSQILDLKGLPLFPPYLSVNDVTQGQFSDCYCLATLAGFVAKKPGRLLKMITTAGSTLGQVATQFFSTNPTYNGRGQIVSVSKSYVSVNSLVQKGGVAAITCSYPAYFEKLWAAFLSLTGVFTWDVLRTGGYPAAVMYAWGMNVQALGNQLDLMEKPLTEGLANNEVAVLTTNKDILDGHCFTILAADYKRKKMVLQNPWNRDGIWGDWQDDGTVEVPFSVLQTAINHAEITSGALDGLPDPVYSPPAPIGHTPPTKPPPVSGMQP